MLGKMMTYLKPITAYLALMRALAGMYLHMLCQMSSQIEPLITNITFVFLLILVHFLMRRPPTWSSKSCIAEATFECLHASVTGNMIFQGIYRFVSLATVGALESALYVRHLMFPQTTFIFCTISTRLAQKWSFLGM